MVVASSNLAAGTVTDKLVIRTSDRATFRRCRAQWDLSSKIRLNWEYIPGVEPLDFGTAIHAGLEIYYDPRRWGEDRSIVTQECLLAFNDHMIDWRARLKRASQWDHMQKAWHEHVQLGTGMLNHFFVWAPKHDQNWEPLKAEIEFEVPIPVPIDYELPIGWFRIEGNLHRMVDRGLAGIAYLPVVYQGRIDLVVKDLKTNKVIIVDHKSAAQLGDYDHLELDTQVSSYCWALRKMLNIDVSAVVFQELRKKAPEEPRQLKSGKLSMDKSQNTTAQLYMQAVQRLGLPMEEYRDFIDFLTTEGQVYFRRIQVDRSPTELAIIERNVLDEALDMLDNPRIYPNPSRFNCNGCLYKEPCIMRQDGSDWEFYLEHSPLYEKRVEK